MSDRETVLREAASKAWASLHDLLYDDRHNTGDSRPCATCEKARAAHDALGTALAAAPPEGPPTMNDEPPWPGWFSCEGCWGWFNDEGNAYDDGRVLCDACAKEKDEDAARVVAPLGGQPAGPWKAKPMVHVTRHDGRDGWWVVYRGGQHTGNPQPSATLASEAEAIAVRDALNGVWARVAAEAPKP